MIRPTILFLALFAAPAWTQGAFWVDPVSGSDANAGTSPGAPFKTISFAMSMAPSAVPSQPVTIHLTPGLYSSATGEQFPVQFRPRVKLIGDGGAAVTRIDGGGASAILALLSDTNTQPEPLDSNTQVRGVTLQNAVVGIDLATDVKDVVPVIEDVVVSGISSVGIRLRKAAGSGGLGPSIRRTAIHAAPTGIGIESMGSTSCSISECILEGGAARGIDVRSTGVGSVALSVVRSSLRGFAQEGIRAELLSSGSVTETLESSLVAQNGGDGISMISMGTGGGAALLSACTVAQNAGVGLRTVHTGLVTSFAAASIFAGNGSGDLSSPGAIVSDCCIQDGTLAGSSGNFAADPQFRNAPGGDFRLRYRSPCVDRLAQSFEVDLLGIQRRVDGNLDTGRSMDLGAYEFEPMEASGTFAIATPVTFSCWGPNAATSVIAADGEVLTNPLATPFGDLSIAFTNAHVIATGSATASAPTAHVVVVPNNPALSGLTFSFQALTVSPLAAAGAAFTNAFTRTVP
ncbi:MAG: right-handed parallel beta-helix repeat-containing protein [Planctomycetes bacterium]|nr:right-handed parallel beta-helix repeat-containing protein [Planctomycetota bacterium]